MKATNRYVVVSMFPDLDHIVPISRGGSDDLSNLQVLCRRCNSSKKDRI